MAVRITVLSDVVAVVASRPDMVMDDVTPIVSAVVGLNVVGLEVGAVVSSSEPRGCSPKPSPGHNGNNETAGATRWE